MEEFEVLFDPNASYNPFNAYSLPSFTIAQLNAENEEWKKIHEKAETDQFLILMTSRQPQKRGKGDLQ